MLSGKKAFRKRQHPEPNSFQPRVNRFPIPEKKLVFFGKGVTLRVTEWPAASLNDAVGTSQARAWLLHYYEHRQPEETPSNRRADRKIEIPQHDNSGRRVCRRSLNERQLLSFIGLYSAVQNLRKQQRFHSRDDVRQLYEIYKFDEELRGLLRVYI